LAGIVSPWRVVMWGAALGWARPLHHGTITVP